MKLITHNMLSSQMIKGVTEGYPLGIKVDKTETVEVDFSPDFIKRMLEKLEWKVLRDAALQLEECKDLQIPDQLSDDQKNDEEILRKIHHFLMEIEIVEGALICPETGREFPIEKGIPNMLLTDEEV